MALKIEGLAKSFGDFTVSVDLEARDEELVVLAGPSGCGKTTALQLIAGLIAPDSGSIRDDGAELSGVPAWERRIGVVFQDLALFPHLSVEGNVGYGPSIAGRPKKEKNEAVSRALKAVSLGGFEKRRVDTLSGGERQRVAIARSLAASPRALLMDEPFSSLDAPLRRRLRRDFRELREREAFPCVFVTHDRDEAAALGDRIAVMRAGRIVECESPQRFFDAPRSAFAARFLGVGAVLPAERNERGILSALGLHRVAGSVTGAIALLVPADALRLVRLGAEGAVPAEAVLSDFEGDGATVLVRLEGGAELGVAADRRSALPRPGERVGLAVDARRLRLVEDDLADKAEA